VKIKGKRIGTLKQASLFGVSARSCRYSSGEYRLPGPNQQVTADLRGKRVLLILKPDKLSFKIANTLLETAHLTDHTEIGPADVAV
jgi:hypothetical protein